MNPFGYPPRVWQLFIDAPRAGELAGGLTAEAATRANGSRLRLQVKMTRSRIDDARFQAYGCPTTIAVGAWIAGWVVGKELQELSGMSMKIIRETLEIPDDRTHCALLGEDLLKSLLSLTRSN
ncbi:MAG TPA: iron-sulfur cluster assembly scaffold protein [Verrucomicrobiae bacterium]|nr:iron-sulfur cluster assembly scaffold protein [Verrucomicrobiae bacterium]